MAKNPAKKPMSSQDLLRLVAKSRAYPRQTSLVEKTRQAFHESIEDKKARWKSSLAANAVFTGLNLAFSAIPFGKTIFDDPTVMRIAQKLDPNFVILKDQITPAQKLLGHVREHLNSGDPARQQQARRFITAVEKRAEQVATQGQPNQSVKAREFLDTWKNAQRYTVRVMRAAEHTTRLRHLALQRRTGTSIRPANRPTGGVDTAKVLAHPWFAGNRARRKIA